jgi:hypothetical protein
MRDRIWIFRFPDTALPQLVAVLANDQAELDNEGIASDVSFLLILL